MQDIVSKLGATQSDLEKLREVSDNLAPDPTLEFRESKNGRYYIDYEASEIIRTVQQPFVLSVAEDFKRHDSGQLRKFADIENDLQGNTAFRALLIFKAYMTYQTAVRQRPSLDYQTANWICTLFNLRVITRPGLIGEPALEGVHSDGVDHTMTTFLGSRNMEKLAAKTRIHDVKEANGVRWNEAAPEYLLAEVQHSEFLDTLMIFDHERKHSVSPLMPEDPSDLARRDMLIFFTRKPAVEGHISFEHDKRNPHSEYPLNVNLR
ncbi:hypothetical protein CVN56_30335 [Rhodococcus sp. AQ5-07]|nr:hypothetical protein CVN56_30335 [Rhodococcus sp. AQ5-07]